jgi:hypothetical protein
MERDKTEPKEAGKVIDRNAQSVLKRPARIPKMDHIKSKLTFSHRWTQNSGLAL